MTDLTYMESLEKHRQNIKQSLIALGLIAGAAIYALIGIARPPEGITVTSEAISSYLFKTGQRIVSRSNMTETIVQNASIATILELTLSTETLVGNGVDSCFVKAVIYDAAGNPVPDGQPVGFTTSSGKFSNGRDTTYTLTTQGKATAWLKSEVVTGRAIFARVEAMTFGVSGQSLTKQLPILFYAAGLRGEIASSAQRPVRGIIVVAYDPVRREAGRDTTESTGTFFIPIEQSGHYTVAFRYKNSFDDDVVLYAPASVDVPATGGTPAVSPLNTIVGSLVDASTGLPVRKSGVSVILYRTSAENPKRGRAMPALQLTDERGVFAFDSLAPGVSEVHVIDVRYSGKLSVQHVENGTFIIDANIALADAPTFEISKNSNKRIAEIGDIVYYNIEVRNTSANATLLNVKVVDDLPPSFVFAKGSAYRDGEVLVDPDNNRRLEWFVADSLPPGKTIKVVYSVYVGAGALESNGINRAYAVATKIVGLRPRRGDTVRTAAAFVQVVVRPGVFSDRGIVIGKVFYDHNEDGRQEEDEHGISGVELLMEDGTRIVTGDDGKYSMPEVRPGQHVLRLNQLTLPYGATLLALHSEFADDGLTRFVRLSEGGIARSDFYVKPPGQAALDAVYSKANVQAVGEQTAALYALKLFEIGSPTRISLVDTLPQGFYFHLNSITWRAMKLFPQERYSRMLWVDFQKRPANSTDTIRLTIVADSSAVGKLLASNGKLVLAYPRGKDAVFAAKQMYGGVDFNQPEQSIPVATKEAKEEKQDTVAQTQSTRDTVLQQAKAADTTRTVAITENRKQQQKTGVKRKASAHKTQVHKPQKVEQKSLEQTLPVPDAEPSADKNAEASEDTSRIVAAIGLIAVGIIFFLFLLIAFRRRKN